MYQENLPSGGVLHVIKNNFYVSFSMQGPDDRYGQREFRIEGDEIDAYLYAYKENYEWYEKHKDQADGMTEIDGKLGMKIRFGLYGGVCIYGHAFPVKSRKGLEKMCDSLQYAKKRAREIIENAVSPFTQ